MKKKNLEQKIFDGLLPILWTGHAGAQALGVRLGAQARALALGVGAGVGRLGVQGARAAGGRVRPEKFQFLK